MDEEPIELSIVMPCLNEADTLGTCIDKALRAIAQTGASAEIIVADNGSTDGSQRIAQERGATVVPVETRGYGAALMGGIAAARGKYVLMGDADDSYDFLEVPRFLEKLREGYALVQGCRLPAGGGTIRPGAMPLLHRVWGNPMLTFLVRSWFGAPIHDVYCGMRAFTRDLYDNLNLRCTGMEFATEMIIRSSLCQRSLDIRIAEIPITLHPDGRTSHAPHLRTFRDGWRTVRLFMIYSPRWLYVVPAVALATIGLGLAALVYGRIRVAGVVFDAHSLLIASLCVLLAYQSLLFGAMAKVFAIGERMLPPDPRRERVFDYLTVERGVAVGLVAALIGFALILKVVVDWSAAGLGQLDYSSSMRWVIPGVTAAALGVQTVFGSFFLSILGMRRK